MRKSQLVLLSSTMDLRLWLRPPAPPQPVAEECDTPATTSSAATTTVSESRAGPSNASSGQPPTDLARADIEQRRSTSPPSQRTAIDDLGTDRPVQTVLKQYPVTLYSGKGRSFVDKWFHNREWLEYSVKVDAAFCF